MATVVINFPIVVECDVKSATNEEESLFRIDKTDMLELSNIKVLNKIVVSASQVSLTSPQPTEEPVES